MPKDGGGPVDELSMEAPPQNDPDVPRTAVVVTDADSPLAEQVVLQLILARYERPAGRLYMPLTQFTWCHSCVGAFV